MGFIFGGTQNDYRANGGNLASNDQWGQKQGFADAIQQAQGRQAPQIATAPQDQFRTAQTGLTGQLQQTAAGQGPSVAGVALKQAGEQNLAASMAQAASARGDVNPAIVQRNLQQNLAGANQTTAAQGAAMKVAEAQNAQGQLAGLTTNARAQDIGLATGQAQLQQQNQGQIDQLTQFYQSLGLNAAEAQLQAQMKAQEINSGITEQNTKNSSGLLGGIISGGAGLGAAALSDERQKMNVKPAGREMDGFLEAIKAHKYEYKKPELPGAGEGTHYSPMAQELERTPVGRSMVLNTPQGKMVDYGKGFGAVLAAQAHLHERLKKIEGRKAA